MFAGLRVDAATKFFPNHVFIFTFLPSPIAYLSLCLDSICTPRKQKALVSIILTRAVN